MPPCASSALAVGNISCQQRVLALGLGGTPCRDKVEGQPAQQTPGVRRGLRRQEPWAVWKQVSFGAVGKRFKERSCCRNDSFAAC